MLLWPLCLRFSWEMKYFIFSLSPSGNEAKHGFEFRHSILNSPGYDETRLYLLEQRSKSTTLRVVEVARRRVTPLNTQCLKNCMVNGVF